MDGGDFEVQKSGRSFDLAKIERAKIARTTGP